MGLFRRCLRDKIRANQEEKRIGNRSFFIDKWAAKSLVLRIRQEMERGFFMFVVF